MSHFSVDICRKQFVQIKLRRQLKLSQLLSVHAINFPNYHYSITESRICEIYVRIEGVSAALSAFFVPGDLDLWPLIVTFELGRDFCTTRLTAEFHRPTFNRSEVIVRRNKLTNWQTNRRCWKHPSRFATLRR